MAQREYLYSGRWPSTTEANKLSLGSACSAVVWQVHRHRGTDRVAGLHCNAKPGAKLACCPSTPTTVLESMSTLLVSTRTIGYGRALQASCTLARVAKEESIPRKSQATQQGQIVLVHRRHVSPPRKLSSETQAIRCLRSVVGLPGRLA